MKKPIVYAFVFLMLVLASNAAKIPVISSYVTDNAGILSQGAKSQLEMGLRDLEKSTNGVQYVIYIEKEYPKEFSLEEYALKIAEQNKIGKKGSDNGILLYIAVNDRKYRWETGYGVESTLNSALLGRISRDYLVPNFQKGDYEEGILKAFDITKRLLLNSSDADIVALKDGANNKINANKVSFGFWVYVLGIFIFFILPTILNAIRNKGKGDKTKKSDNSFYNAAAWGLFAGGFGRGGFGGGGFGGFSGGGGGFGGGGHSGGW